MIGIITFLLSVCAVNAQTDILEGRNMERVHVDKSGEPYVTVTYDLDLKSNITKEGITGAFVIATIISKTVGQTTVAQTYEIKCEERMIRFSTASDVKVDKNGRLVVTEPRQLTDQTFVNPFTDRGLKSFTREAYKAILTKSCATEL